MNNYADIAFVDVTRANSSLLRVTMVERARARFATNAKIVTS